MCSFYVYVLLFFDFSGFRECCQEFFHGFAQAVAFLAEEGLSNRYVWHGERTEGEGFCRIDIAFVPDDDAECHFAFSGVHGGGACVEGEEDSRDDVVGAEEFLDDFFGASADGERLSGEHVGRDGLVFCKKRASLRACDHDLAFFLSEDLKEGRIRKRRIGDAYFRDAGADVVDERSVIGFADAEAEVRVFLMELRNDFLEQERRVRREDADAQGACEACCERFDFRVRCLVCLINLFCLAIEDPSGFREFQTVPASSWIDERSPVFFFHQLELTGQCRLCDMDLARCLIEAPRLDDRNEIFVKFQIQVNSPLFY